VNERLLGLIREDALGVFVFGPGFGESIAIRVPPGAWLVVDSLGQPQSSDARKVPALDLIRAAGERTTVVVYTHPHLDHAVGLPQIVASHRDGHIGCWFARNEVVPDVGDPDRLSTVRRSVATSASLAIVDSWERGLSQEWALEPGSSRPLGDGSVMALSPSAAVRDRALEGLVSDPNELSTALEVRWRNARLILGADLPIAGWDDVVALSEQPLEAHAALKLPHHASENARHEGLTRSARAPRLWVATPYDRGRKLPDFAHDGGLDRLLAAGEEVHLTALGRRANSLPADRRIALEDLRKRLGASRRNGIDFATPATAEIWSAWIAAALDANGVVIDTVSRGPSAVTVTTR
jgi:hypothetical protein